VSGISCLLAAMHELERRRCDHEALGRPLADAIGEALAAAEGIERRDRNLVADVRRRLYNGRPIEPEECSRVIEIAIGSGHDPTPWREPLRAAVAASRALLELDQRIDRAAYGEVPLSAGLDRRGARGLGSRVDGR
jgi:hypothetical protein